MRQRFEWAGWLLFLFGCFGFLIDTWLSRAWWGFGASVLFTGGVIAFLVPMVHATLQPRAGLRRTGAPEAVMLGVPIGATPALASLGDGQPGLEPTDDPAIHVGDVLEAEL